MIRIELYLENLIHQKINPNKVNPSSKNFNIITVSTNNIDLVSPELLESYLLNKILKENKYYPLANIEI